MEAPKSVKRKRNKFSYIQWDETPDRIHFSWSTMSMFMIFLGVFLLVALAAVLLGLFGIGLGENDALVLTTQAQLWFWPIWSVLLLHFLFNRVSRIELNREGLVRRKGRFPARTWRASLLDVQSFEIQLKSRKFDIAESPTGLPDTDFYYVLANLKGGNQKRLTESLTKENAGFISEKLQDHCNIIQA